MILIDSAVSGRLVWSKTSHRRGYELKCQGEVVASLQRASCWSSESQAESEHGKWRFRRTGFLRPGTEIVDANSGARIAALKPNWCGGGMLEFSEGQRFRLKSNGIWRPILARISASTDPSRRIARSICCP